MERRIRPWINKKIAEYIGEPEPILVDFICSKILVGSTPQAILDDVQTVSYDAAPGGRAVEGDGDWDRVSTDLGRSVGWMQLEWEIVRDKLQTMVLANLLMCQRSLDIYFLLP